MGKHYEHLKTDMGYAYSSAKQSLAVNLYHFSFMGENGHWALKLYRVGCSTSLAIFHSFYSENHLLLRRAENL